MSEQQTPQETPQRVAPEWLRKKLRSLRSRQGSGSTDYLDAKWGLAWLRWDDPDAVIETRILDHGDTFALFVATIALSGGGGSATGHGTETKGDFGDFHEKAETKAVRRALNHLGYSVEMLETLTGDGPETETFVVPAAQSGVPVTGDAREQGSYAWVMAEIAAGQADGEKFGSFYNSYIAKLPEKEQQNSARKAAQARRQ